jgi:hypothetical protein
MIAGVRFGEGDCGQRPAPYQMLTNHMLLMMFVDYS